jgi:hypothetical protein
MRLRLLAAGALVLAALAPLAHAGGGAGIRELVVPDEVDYASADGGSIAFDRSIGLNCDAITIWRPLAGTKERIKPTGFCDEGGQSDGITLAGQRLLWEDGFSANTYSDYSVFTLDTSKSVDAKKAAPETSYEPKTGPVQNARLWRIDGRRKMLIRRGLDFVALSVDGTRIAGSGLHGPISLLGADGHTINTFQPPVDPVRVVVLSGNELAVAGGRRLAVLDARLGWVKTVLGLPAGSRFQDYADGLATFVHGNSIHVLRVSDGKDVVVARLRAKGIEGYTVASEIEPQGLYYTYTTAHVVFVPWNTLARLTA